MRLPIRNAFSLLVIQTLNPVSIPCPRGGAGVVRCPNRRQSPESPLNRQCTGAKTPCQELARLGKLTISDCRATAVNELANLLISLGFPLLFRGGMCLHMPRSGSFDRVPKSGISFVHTVYNFRFGIVRNCCISLKSSVYSRSPICHSTGCVPINLKYFCS